MTDHLVFQSVEDRDAMLQPDMKEEMVSTMDLLAEVLQRQISQTCTAPVHWGASTDWRQARTTRNEADRPDAVDLHGGRRDAHF